MWRNCIWCLSLSHDPRASKITPKLKAILFLIKCCRKVDLRLLGQLGALNLPFLLLQKPILPLDLKRTLLFYNKIIAK